MKKPIIFDVSAWGLKFYTLFGYFLWPFLQFYLRLRYWQGKERDLAARFGRMNKARPEGRLIWIHAASVGETAALLPLIEGLLSRSYLILLTTQTVTAEKFVRQMLGNKVIHSYVPLDIKIYLQRFLNHWQPFLFISCESEIWPMRILQLARRQIPQFIVNARLSDKTFGFWQKFPQITQFLFQKFDHIFAQTVIDGQKYQKLGAKNVTVVGNLKAEVDLSIAQNILQFYQKLFAKRVVWAAVSTHAGEEEHIIYVHQKLRQKFPNLLTILVPRHPERLDEIIALLSKYGISYGRRCEENSIVQDIEFFVGDTIGEMRLYLQLACVAFIGKSLGARGGHNPLEAIKLSIPVISGTAVDNFAEIYQKLQQEQAVCLVENANALCDQLGDFLQNSQKRKQYAQQAQAVVQNMQGVSGQILSILQRDYWIDR